MNRKTTRYSALRRDVQRCRGCALYKNATQAVFGEGPLTARLVLVGEQPGDQEDRQGHPFVGPSGRLLDRALAEAGVDRGEIYVTNAVKHFKWQAAGKRRLHKRPSTGEVRACRPWFLEELRLVRPELIVCLGATAAQCVFGKTVGVNALRGAFHETELGTAYVTLHPSALLRAPDELARERMFREYVDDFRRIEARLKTRARAIA